MRALTYQGKRSLSVETVPDPVIVDPTDAIVR
ncbi:MAG: Alcohol dehydrogenase GroES-associated, partial [Actinomycetota bacterium]|nr:Alcohol dehydrogenase GroES-associated [Actinomycetota bacterium]